MMTVRFPNGQTVQYNNAWYVKTHAVQYALYDRENGNLQAFVPLSCIIEWVPACRVFNAMDEPALKEVRRNLNILKDRITARKIPRKPK